MIEGKYVGWAFRLSGIVYQDYYNYLENSCDIELPKEYGIKKVHCYTVPPPAHRNKSETLVLDCGRILIEFVSVGYSEEDDAKAAGKKFQDTIIKYFAAHNIRCNMGLLRYILDPDKMAVFECFRSKTGKLEYNHSRILGISGPSARYFKPSKSLSNSLKNYVSDTPLTKQQIRGIALKTDFILGNCLGIGGSGDFPFSSLAINVSIIESFINQQSVSSNVKEAIDKLASTVDKISDINPQEIDYLKQGIFRLKRQSIKQSVCTFIDEKFPIGSFSPPPPDIECVNESAGYFMSKAYDARSKFFHDSIHQDEKVNSVEKHFFARYLINFVSEITGILLYDSTYANEFKE